MTNAFMYHDHFTGSSLPQVTKLLVLSTLILLPPLGIAEEISGPATVRRKGQLMELQILGVREGKVTALGPGVPLKFDRGEVTEIWLQEKESLPGIADSLRKKYTFDRKSRRFVARNPIPEVKISAWDVAQASELRTSTRSTTAIGGGIAVNSRETYTYRVFADTASASATVENVLPNAVNVHITLLISGQVEGVYVNTATTLDGYESDLVTVEFATDKKEVAAATLVDYVIKEIRE